MPLLKIICSCAGVGSVGIYIIGVRRLQSRLNWEAQPPISPGFRMLRAVTARNGDFGEYLGMDSRKTHMVSLVCCHATFSPHAYVVSLGFMHTSFYAQNVRE